MTAMTPLREYLPLVLPYAPDVSEPMALVNLRLAANEFLKRTRLWREVIRVTLVDQPVELSLANTNAVLVAMEKAMTVSSNRDLEPADYDNLPMNELNDTTESRPARCFYQRIPGEFSVYPFEAGDFDVSVFLAPEVGPRFGINGASTLQDDQNTAPTFVFERYSNIVADGALAKILATPRHKFTDYTMAGHHRTMFDNEVRKLGAKHLKGDQGARLRVKAHWF